MGNKEPAESAFKVSGGGVGKMIELSHGIHFPLALVPVAWGLVGVIQPCAEDTGAIQRAPGPPCWCFGSKGGDRNSKQARFANAKQCAQSLPVRGQMQG